MRLEELYNGAKKDVEALIGTFEACKRKATTERLQAICRISFQLGVEAGKRFVIDSINSEK